MDAATTTTNRTPLVQLARAAMLTAIAGYGAIAISLIARRIAGALEPLDAPLLLSLAVSVPAAILLARMLWPTSNQRDALDWFVRVAPSASAISLAAAVSLRGSSPPALAALWLAIVAVEATMTSRELWSRTPRVARFRSPSPVAIRGAPLGREITQSLVRETTSTGETITGELRGVLRPGERTIFLHIAFCPPLANVPNIQCEQIAGPDAEINVTQSQMFGARFDVRLKRECSDAADVQLRFVAVGRISNPSTQESYS